VTGRLTVRDPKGRLTMSADLRANLSDVIEGAGVVAGTLMRPSANLRENVSLLFLPPDYTFVGGRLGLTPAPRSAVKNSKLRNCRARAGSRR
jgi:hypothetical protein